MRHETDIEDSFAEKAKEYGCLAIKLEVPGWRNWPDRLCLVTNTTGRVFFLEFKKPGKTARKGQQIRIRKLRRMGYLAEVVDTVDDAMEYLHTFRWLYNDTV